MPISASILLTTQAPIRHTVELIAEAERAGFDSVFLMAQDAGCRDPFLTASIALLKTRRIVINVLVSESELAGPSQLSRLFATLDELASGRFNVTIDGSRGLDLASYLSDLSVTRAKLGLADEDLRPWIAFTDTPAAELLGKCGGALELSDPESRARFQTAWGDIALAKQVFVASSEAEREMLLAYLASELPAASYAEAQAELIGGTAQQIAEELTELAALSSYTSFVYTIPELHLAVEMIRFAAEVAALVAGLTP